MSVLRLNCRSVVGPVYEAGNFCDTQHRTPIHASLSSCVFEDLFTPLALYTASQTERRSLLLILHNNLCASPYVALIRFTFLPPPFVAPRVLLRVFLTGKLAV
jgi:hypothetical protein